MGHLGLEHCSDLLRDRFYWANMGTDIENHIKACDGCLCFKAKPQKTELHPIMATHLMELIHIEYPSIESGKADKDAWSYILFTLSALVVS